MSRSEQPTSLAGRLRAHARENRSGMLADLAFAVVWVAMISLLFQTLFAGAPTWVFYMFMLSGIPAYFGFFLSLAVATRGER